MLMSEMEEEMKNGKVNGSVYWSFTLNGVAAFWHKCGTAKIDNPDDGFSGAGFDKNVLQFYVPVEHTPGVDPDESIHQLFDDSLSGRNIRGKLGTHLSLLEEHVQIVSVVIFKTYF